MLLRVPEGWPQPVAAAVAMILLAVLDLAGSLAAKEAVERRSVGLAVAGAGCFLAVFWVYMSSLQVAELSAVTFGWVVILQVGVVLLDRFRYGVIPAPGTWLAIAVLLAAQAYLILAPAGSAQSIDQGVEAAQNEAAELHHAERADGDAADQQGLADGLVSRVVHVPPQRDAANSPALTTQE
jgi:hypothetical protein